MTAPMTAADVDRALAKEMGWVEAERFDIHGAGWTHAAWKIPQGSYIGTSFFPSTSSDHLRLYVLPEIERRGLVYEFLGECAGIGGDAYLAETYAEWFLLTADPADPAVLARAALDVLRGGE